MDTETPPEAIAPSLVKISVSFEPEDYEFVVSRSKDLFGRRGQGQYLRMLVKDDRARVMDRGPDAERARPYYGIND